MKVLITAPWFTSSCLNDLKKNFDVTQNDKKTWFSEAELIRLIPEYDAVIAGLDPFTSAVIEEAKHLKIIARRGIGYNNIDLEACKRKGIVVTNTPVPEEHLAVAEFTVGMIFNVLRNITLSHNSLQSGSWERRAFLGKDLYTSHVGILGLGKIGREVARMLTAMGIRVSYYDPYVNDDRYRKVDADTLFRECDVISVHLPLTPETRGFVNAKRLSLMKKGSYIVNTSRGEVLVESDVVSYIDNGTLRGVATDVFSQEPPKNSLLFSRRAVITTPHIGAYSENSFLKIDCACVEAVYNVLIERKEPKFRIV
ncbi:MAG: phosphoglycerate dehydrogenase [Candidatus Parvarchaeota archaeon]